MSEKGADEGRRVWFEPAPVEAYRYAGHGRIKAFEARLPVLQGLSDEARAALVAQARPGESWEQLVERVRHERRAAFLADATACRLCHSIEQYQTERCKRMGLCDACNASLEAEAGTHLGADDA